MKLWKILAALAVLYVGVVVAFEALLGWYQPQGGNTVVITTTDDAGQTRDRVVSRLDSDGKIYVAANHWPRAWYRQVLEHPAVQVTIDGERAGYTAVPVTPEEHERLQAEHPHSLGFRVLTGFPPRRFVRLDPQ
jgi:predicted GTPase